MTILALQPKAQRIGYAVFEGAVLIDWGVKTLQAVPLEERTSVIAVPLVQILIQLHEPDCLVLPDATGLQVSFGNRFIRAICNDGNARGISVWTCTRKEVRDSFKSLLHSTPTRSKIMEVLAKWFPELRARLPKPKRPYQALDYWVSMFDAVALAVTWLERNN